MKKLLIGLLVLGSISSIASVNIITFKSPRVGIPGGRIEELRHIDLRSNKDGICRYLGADEYVKRSIKKSRSRQFLGCPVPEEALLYSDRFSTINSDGIVIENYIAKTYETPRSKLKKWGLLRRWGCSKIIKTIKYQIDEIKCIKY